MLRELLAKEQSEKNISPDNERPPVSNHQNQVIGNQKDDEDFVPVSHRDVDDQDEDMEDIDSDQSHEEELPSSPPPVGLQRVSGNIQDVDDEPDHSFLHPLVGHLQGRLLNRSRNLPNKFDPLHPYTTVLSLGDVDHCVKLEEDAFPENERCSREKFVYRLSKCPELSLGIFSRPTISEMTKSANAKVNASKPSANQTARAKDAQIKAAMLEVGKPELIAHIIATRTPAPCVTDASMNFPQDWKDKSTLPNPDETEALGHQDQGGTICIHSLAVGKAHQGKSLGSTLLKAYVQRIKDSKIADRVALLAHDHLVKFYVDNGFEDMGESACTFGGGNWRNLVMEFGDQHDD